MNIKTQTPDSFNPSFGYESFEDFLGDWATATVRNIPWLLAVTNGNVQSIAASIANRPGIVSIGLANTGAGDFAAIRHANSLLDSVPANFQLLFSHLQGQAAAAVFDQRLGIGVTPAVAGELATWIGFRSVGAGNWFAVTRNGGAETAVDSGIAQKAANAWTKFMISTNAAGSAVTFSIDGAIVAINTTNLPAAGSDLTTFAKADFTGAGALEFFGLDYIFEKQTGLTR